MGQVEIGISGWTYEGWRGIFYPEKLPHKKELEFASHIFSTIEINGTFYSLQGQKSYLKWYETTPSNFIFSVKANRYITHFNRIKTPLLPTANFFASGVLALREKLGPILWQFPPSMRFEPERFEDFFKLLPHTFKQAAVLGRRSILKEKYLKVVADRRIRHAIEVRHSSFLNPLFIELLREYRIALVFADTAGKWPYFEDITSDFIYVRLHGDSMIYASGYSDGSLSFWSKRIKKWQMGKEADDRLTISEDTPTSDDRDVFVYFDNDAKVRAPADAQALITKIKEG